MVSVSTEKKKNSAGVHVYVHNPYVYLYLGVPLWLLTSVLIISGNSPDINDNRLVIIVYYLNKSFMNV